MRAKGDKEPSGNFGNKGDKTVCIAQDGFNRKLSKLEHHSRMQQRQAEHVWSGFSREQNRWVMLICLLDKRLILRIDSHGGRG